MKGFELHSASGVELEKGKEAILDLGREALFDQNVDFWLIWGVKHLHFLISLLIRVRNVLKLGKSYNFECADKLTVVVSHLEQGGWGVHLEQYTADTPEITQGLVVVVWWVEQELRGGVPDIRGGVIRVLKVNDKGRKVDFKGFGVLEVALHPYLLRIQAQMRNMALMQFSDLFQKQSKRSYF